MGLAHAREVRRDIAPLIRPPERLTVSEACEKYVKVRSATGSIIPWDPDLTPYMIEPMNLLNSREYDAVVFVGPAQSGKTQSLITGFSAYIMKCAPADFMILQTTKGTARDFDTQVIKRAFRDSPELKEELAPGNKSDNTYDKVFKSGSVLFQRWPSINELSGKPLKFMLLTDYDRMTQNIDGEGSPFSLSQIRTNKFLSRGMTVVDTSPGFQVEDSTWRPRVKHEAPPCRGALSLFNMGDMRRRYVECPECGEYYMPPPDERGLDFPHLRDMLGATITEINREVSYVCSKNGCLIDTSHKREMNRTGLWVPQGCHIEDGKVVGEKRKSRIASFWFPGIFAAYSDPEALAQKFLNGCREYDITGAEENLKTCLNVDFGSAFTSRNLISAVSAEEYQNRAEGLPKRMVPEGVRFLIAAIDVQGWGFEVQVSGYGQNYERWVIDRYAIRISNRIEDGQPTPCDPAAYLEDWDLIIEKVMDSTYALADGSGRVMGIKKTTCDSGGKAGVTTRAYAFWRRLRKDDRRLDKSFMLVKGERPKPEANKATITKSFPENTSKNKKKANGRGEIPLWLLNTTRLKDSVSNDLARNRVGPGYIHFPNWLKLSFFEELTVETRTESGWESPKGKRNETFDLICYGDAGVKALMQEMRIFSIDWDKPPIWAEVWDKNALVFESSEASTNTKNAAIAGSPLSLFDTNTTKSSEL
jgi:phage terminase large subunit GpA-like protein